MIRDENRCRESLHKKNPGKEDLEKESPGNNTVCREIVREIEKVYPVSAALDFDNVGLLAGRYGKEVRRIYLALDATEDVICRAEKAGADMLITHHPLIFSPLKRVTDGDFVGRRVLRLIQSDMAYYAMHTNYDVLGMAGLAERILQLKDTEVLDVTMTGEEGEQGIGRIGTSGEFLPLKEYSALVKNRLKLETLRIYGDLNRIIHRVAVSPGSGKSAVKPAAARGADVLITGDIGHHDGLDAVEQGLAVIDAGHYGTEYIFMDDMKQFLDSRFPGIDILTDPVSWPFYVL